MPLQLVLAFMICVKSYNTPPCGIDCCKGAIALLEKYPVWIGDRQIGNAQISKIGLFYEIIAECMLPDTRIYRLQAQCASGTKPLGILAPCNGAFSVRAKISADKMQLKNIRFFANPVHGDAHLQLMRVCPDLPFEKIDQLEEMNCVVCDGKVFLTLADGQSDSDA